MERAGSILSGAMTADLPAKATSDEEYARVRFPGLALSLGGLSLLEGKAERIWHDAKFCVA